jgi:hypothetical protein
MQAAIELLEEVFSVPSVSRLYNEKQLRLRESLETFHKMLEKRWLAKQSLAYEEGLCFRELLHYLNTNYFQTCHYKSEFSEGTGILGSDTRWQRSRLPQTRPLTRPWSWRARFWQMQCFTKYDSGEMNSPQSQIVRQIVTSSNFNSKACHTHIYIYIYIYIYTGCPKRKSQCSRSQYRSF